MQLITPAYWRISYGDRDIDLPTSERPIKYGVKV